MSTRNANELIKEARIKAGYTQEQMSAGICTVQALSKIELGQMGVSSGTFQSLMERAGASCECFPVFANRNDYEISHLLKLSRTYLDSNLLDHAFNQLIEVQKRLFSSNRLHYQEWLFQVALLKIKSNTPNYSEILTILTYAVHITRPNYENQNITNVILTKTEYELLILLCASYLECKDLDQYTLLSTSLEKSILDTSFSSIEKDALLTKLSIVQIKYLISNCKYDDACMLAQKYRNLMLKNADYSYLLEITFLLGISFYHKNKMEDAMFYINAVLYSSHAIHSSFFTFCKEYITNCTPIILSDYIYSLKPVAITDYSFIQYYYDYSVYSEGIFNQDSPTVYTLCDLIYETRLDRNISQKKLCQGLCSKSKLSKLENGIQQPSIFLTEALLQRLGLSERYFTFWGNEIEATYYDMKSRLVHSQISSASEQTKYLEKLESLVNPKDTIPYQFFLTIQAQSLTSNDDKIESFKKALSLTLPGFDFYNISSYSLSWIELSILNNLAHSYQRAGQYYYASLIFEQLLIYQKNTTLDFMLFGNIYPITNIYYAENLYKQGNHKENLDFFSSINPDLFSKNMNLYAFLLFFICQSAGHSASGELCELYTTYCVHLNNLLELKPNAIAIEHYIMNDFGIKLHY